MTSPKELLGRHDQSSVSPVRAQPQGRYIDAEAEEVLADLQAGETLTLERAFDYDHPSSFARRLKRNEAALGWLPDYVIRDVDRLEQAGHRFRVEVVRVQPPGGNPHLRLLCKLVVDA